MKYYIGSMAYGHEDIRHYGVQGMKWGVRRYQNEDGTLTELGRKRVYQTSGYGYLNPPNKHYAKKSEEPEKTKHRMSIAEEYAKKYWEGVGKGTISTSSYTKAGADLWASFHDSYASATLKDLGFTDTKAARKQVEDILRAVSNDYDEESAVHPEDFHRPTWKELRNK